MLFTQYLVARTILEVLKGQCNTTQTLILTFCIKLQWFSLLESNSLPLCNYFLASNHAPILWVLSSLFYDPFEL